MKDQREATRERVKRYRERHRSVTETGNDVTPLALEGGVTLGKDVTPNVTLGANWNETILAMADPVRAEKMARIIGALEEQGKKGRKDLLNEVRYGVNGPTLGEIAGVFYATE